MILLRGGLFTPDVVLVADPKVRFIFVTEFEKFVLTDLFFQYVTEALAFDRKGAMYDSLRLFSDNDLFFSDGA